MARERSVVKADVPPLDAAALHKLLLAWYRRHARKLPWRRTRDPYRIWVSEVMLQQTQVATATPYYERFLERFPDVTALAAAPVDDVLAVWSGLGYYRRARFLHAAAGVVVREHAGAVPGEKAAFAALPGVGRYTVGAVLSIGFGVPLPVLDGNVARVFARWVALPLQIKRPADSRALWTMAETLMPAGGAKSANPGDWNQALMELGATVCTPRAPRCGTCPVQTHCRARALGTPEAFPSAAARRATEHVRRAVVLIERDERWLVVQREGVLLSGMWEPPGVELEEGDAAAEVLRTHLRALGIRARLTSTGRIVRHAITHRSIEVEVWRGELEGTPRAAARLRWAHPGGREVAFTSLVGKLAAAEKALKSARAKRTATSRLP